MSGKEFARISGSYSTAWIGTWELLSQSSSGNSSKIRLRGYFYYGGGTQVVSSYSTFTLHNSTVKTGSYTYTPGYHLLGQVDITVGHNSDGSFPTTSISISANTYHISGNTKGNISGIPKINRYADFTTHKINSTTTNSISVTWSANATCDSVQYSINGGSWVTTSGTTYTISGLECGTTYSIKTKIRRKDSQLWTTSGSISGTTKDCIMRPKINGTWKEGVPYININGTWKKGVPFINVNGTWKKGV